MRALGVTILLLGALLTGCIGSTDEALEKDQADLPDTVEEASQLPDTITGIEQLAQLDESDEVSGAGIWTHGDHAYVSGLSSGFHIVDISDPEAPTRVGSLSGDQVYSRDADMIEYPNQTVAVLATQSGGMTFVDVTEPTEPTILNILEIEPNHNVAVVPGTSIVYNSPSSGEGRANEIVDASDPLTAEVVAEFGEFGCHDISFFIDEDQGKHRAYCAGVDITQIWDIQDPLNPTLVSEVSNPCMDDTTPAPRSDCGGLHHSAFVNNDGTILIMGDEFQGGAGPGCGANAETPTGTSASSPVGALWFYDISDETSPALLGWFAPQVPVQNHAEALTGAATSNPTSAPFSASCTSHFGEVLPGKEMVVMAWYDAGVLLIDFSDPANPVLVDQWNEGTATWDAQVHQGHIVTGDMSRGLDVLGFLGE